VKALSIRQPWAHAILHWGKDVENREWDGCAGWRAFRGEFLIHASSWWRPDDILDAVDACRDILGVARLPGEILTLRMLKAETGGIVGRARIVDVRRNTEAAKSRWEVPGSWSLVLADVRPVPFVPCKGALGFFEVPPDVLAQVAA
jgi:hypothetical protein